MLATVLINAFVIVLEIIGIFVALSIGMGKIALAITFLVFLHIAIGYTLLDIYEDLVERKYKKGY